MQGSSTGVQDEKQRSDNVPNFNSFTKTLMSSSMNSLIVTLSTI